MYHERPKELNQGASCFATWDAAVVFALNLAVITHCSEIQCTMHNACDISDIHLCKYTDDDTLDSWHELHVCDIDNWKPLVLCISIKDLRTHDEPDQTIWNLLPRKGEGERPGIKISRSMHLRFAQSAQSYKEVICWVTPPGHAFGRPK